MGLPLRWIHAKLTGSVQFGLVRAFGGLPGPCSAPYCACRLSMVSAAHQCVRSHEIELMNGGCPGG